VAGRIEQEIAHLDALVEELLTLHRLESTDEASVHAPAKASVDLVELLAAITDDAAFESSALGGTVVLTSDGPFIARVNGELVYRAFENVIRNAVRYSPGGTVVEVHAALKAADSTLVVEVRDRGPGVPPDRVEAIFEPFVRLERSATVRGTGLGLAIAKRAIVSQGGRIEASPREGGGLVMRMEIPAGS
jgi:signal transduction histidine kinase